MEEGRARFDKASNIIKGVDSFAKAILLVKLILDLVIQNIPQAALTMLPWGGICVRLEVSIHYYIISLLANIP